jgi:DNA polymerase-3 subunit gamma/tau
LKVESQVLTLIARQATGSLRDAVSLLDQLASTTESISLDIAQSVLGTATSQAVLEIVDAIFAADSAIGLDHIHNTLDSGSDPRQFARQIVDYLRNLLLIRMGNAGQVDATSEIRAQMAQHAQAFPVNELLRLIRTFNQAANEIRSGWQPALPLELAFVESLEQPPEGKSPQPASPSRAETAPFERKREPRSARSSKPQVAVKSAPLPTETAPTDSPAEPLPKNVAQHWRQILTLVRQENPQTQALLNSCKPLGVKSGALILGFNGEFAKSKMEQGDNLKILGRVMKQLLGEAMPVRCVMSAGGELPDDIDQDGMVASALRDLGGEIVDIQ